MAVGFKLAGTRFYISFGFFMLLSLYMVYDRSGTGFMALSVIAIHEGGHILMMLLTGAKLHRMAFYPYGIQIEKTTALSYAKEAAVYSGGVAANLATGLIAWGIYGFCPFVQYSLTLIIFNLLPVGRLDGGQLLHLLVTRNTNPITANRIESVVYFAILAILFTLSFVLLLGGNVTMLLTTIYLVSTLWRE